MNIYLIHSLFLALTVGLRLIVALQRRSKCRYPIVLYHDVLELLPLLTPAASFHHRSDHPCLLWIADGASSQLVAYLDAAGIAAAGKWSRRRGGESFNDFCWLLRLDTTVSGRSIAAVAAAAKESTRSGPEGRKEGKRRQESTFCGRCRCATRRCVDGRQLLTAGAATRRDGSEYGPTD